MDTQYLREFVVLAECMSYSEAAERLFISQSSLSKHIMALEKEVGQTLFNRSTRNIALSDAGHIFLHYATQIVLHDEDCRNALDAYASRREHTITLAVMQNPEYYDLRKYVVGFRKLNPNLTLNLVEEDEAGMLALFNKKQVNLMATFRPDMNKVDCGFLPMVKDTVVALVHPDNPLAGKSKITLNDLRHERLILPKRNSTMSRIVLDAFRKAGIIPDIFYEGSSIGCADLVKEGLGTSLHAREFALTTIRNFSDEVELVMVELEQEITYIYGLAYRDVSELTVAERAFLDATRQYEIEG